MHRRAFLQASLGAAVGGSISTFSSASEVSNTLRSAAATRKMVAGSAVSNQQLRDPVLAAILAQQCGIVVPESEMKWKAIHPEPNRYDFAAADELVAFAGTNSMLVRGHNLCWHDAQPSWLPGLATPDNAARLLEEHIRTVAGHYAGHIHSWDVVNEAIQPQDNASSGLRNSFWLKLLGPRYIAIAFHAAAEADRRAILTYNEYGLEEDGNYNEVRRQGALALFRWMRKNRIPIDAVGLQSHLTARFPEMPNWGGLHSFLKKVAKLELQVFVTELDIDDSNLAGDAQSRGEWVAWLCRDYLKNVLSHPHVTAVLTWGLVSHGSYRSTNADHPDDVPHRALPLDEHLQPTPFLAAMLDVLHKR
ncbi:MAG: endo-1,4-beta-xylanase [Candidatus Acidiferrales bacterium]